MLFNVNSYVRVKLTDKGRSILEAQALELRKAFPRLPPYAPRQQDENGRASFQLWELMQKFGPHIGLGCDPCFETTIELVTP